MGRPGRPTERGQAFRPRGTMKRSLLVSTLAALVAALAGLPPTGARANWEVGIHEGVPWPIDPPPVDHLVPVPLFGPPPEAPTPGAEGVLRALAGVRESLRSTRYQHRTFVSERRGIYHWDCSGMAAWVLDRGAPRARSAVGGDRPVARTFARLIERSPTRGSRLAWQRVERIVDARPGDVFAWRRPRGFPSRNTGHVGFVLNRPRPVPGLPGGVAVRIADATSFGHQDDTRRDDSDGGYGEGTVVFLVDPAGRGTHYGWAGTLSGGYVRTPILIGRVHR